MTEAPASQTSTPEAVPPRELHTASPKDMEAADIAQCRPVSLEAPIDKIVDVALHGSNDIGTLSQFRRGEPEFLTILTLVMRSGGVETAAGRSYSSYAAAQIANPTFSATPPAGDSLDLAA